MKLRNKLLIAVILILAAGLYYYVSLPAFNFHSSDTWFFVLFLLAAVLVIYILRRKPDKKELKNSKMVRFLGTVILGVGIVYLLGSLLSSPIINAKKYQKLLTVKEGEFTEDVEELSFDKIPLLDKDTAEILGDRKMGSMVDMVSQFEVDSIYSQINYKDNPVRVSPLRYANLIKWFTNRSSGLPAYIIIDMVSQEAEVVRLPEGMRYTTAEHFGRNLYRHLRFHYPTMMFDEPVFEIDEAGTPFWVCPRIVRTIGLFGGVDVKGAVLVNAVTGESEYYEQVPNWVDRLYSYDIIMQQYNFYGMYHNGFLNSMFGQKDVTVTTEGWNYIAIDDDVYMYTGVTSVTSDQSNIGFILSNQRTKETKFYPCAGATEQSAQESAQSQVQQMSYEATFPLLLNIAGQPSYFMALKGRDGLVKMFAMVNVQQYDVVSTGATVAECESSYRQTLAHRGLIAAGEQTPAAGNAQEQDGVVTEIRSAVIGGDTHYYVRMENSLGYLDFNASEVPLAVLLNVRDHIRYTFVLEGAEFPEHGIVPATGFVFVDWDN